MEIKNREKILAIAVGAGLLLLLGNVLLVKPLTRSWRDRSERISGLTAQIRAGHQLLARGPSVLERWDRMESNALPSTATLAESQLFNAFDGWVRDAGVTQGSFHPQVKETDDNYSMLECRADVSGDLQQVFNFLYDLEKDPIALKLDSVGLTSRDDNGRQIVLVLEMSGLMLPAPQP